MGDVFVAVIQWLMWQMVSLVTIVTLGRIKGKPVERQAELLDLLTQLGEGMLKNDFIPPPPPHPVPREVHGPPGVPPGWVPGIHQLVWNAETKTYVENTGQEFRDGVNDRGDDGSDDDDDNEEEEELQWPRPAPKKMLRILGRRSYRRRFPARAYETSFEGKTYPLPAGHASL